MFTTSLSPTRRSLTPSTRALTRAGVTLFFLALTLPLCTSSVLADGTTTLVSVNVEGKGGGNADSHSPSISADGRFVAFTSSAANLTANDSGSIADVFLRDTRTGKTTLVSVNGAGAGGGNGESGAPSVSADGRFVAFMSAASDLTPDDSGSVYDVFVRDLQTGKTTLASVNRTGKGGGNADSAEPSISADGRFVAFMSHASDLTADSTGNTFDFFVRDLKSGTTTLVSVNSGGKGAGNSNSMFPSISADGRFVAFMSMASNLTADDSNSTDDIFVRDLKTGKTTLVSVDGAGIRGGNGESADPSVSADGRFVAFMSTASDLTPDDSDSTEDVFVRDLQTDTTTLVSVSGEGTGSGNSGSGIPSISADGRFVAFMSYATDLTPDDTSDIFDIFVRDMQTGKMTLVSVSNAGAGGGNGDSWASSISADGRFVAFESWADNLVAHPTADSCDMFVRDLGPLPPLVGFGSAGFGVDENGPGQATVTITRTGDASTPATVKYRTSDGTATAGSDYKATSGTISFAAGETRQTFIVTVVNDTLSEPAETINVTLSDPSAGTNLSRQSQAAVTIADDDPETYSAADGVPDSADNGPAFADAPQTGGDDDGAGDAYQPGSLQLSSPVYNFFEGEGSAVVTVSRTAGSMGAVSVAFYTGDGTAQNGDDYQETRQVLTFADGDATDKTIRIPLTKDSKSEPNETVSLRLDDPTGGASLGSPATAVLTIMDGDGSVLLSSLSLDADTLHAGSSSTGTVKLTGPAPAGGALVMLSSSQAGVVMVPASVTVAEGATSAKFTVTCGRVATPSSTIISAERGYITRSAGLTLVP